MISKLTFKCVSCRRVFSTNRRNQKWCASEECRVDRNKRTYKTWLNKPGKREEKNAYSRAYSKKFMRTKRRGNVK